MHIQIKIVALALGAVWGSFCNMLISRIPSRQSISGRSRCPECENTLRVFDLIPILSYIILRGKCRHCGQKISSRYLMVEILMSVLFLLSYIQTGPRPVHFLIYISYCTAAILVAFIDFEKTIIPNIVLLPAALIALCSSAFTLHPQAPHLTVAMIGGILGGAVFLLLAIVTGGAGMGMGDVKLVAFMGLTLGPLPLIPAVLLGSLSALLFAAVVMLYFRKHLQSIKSVEINLDTEEPEITQRVLGMTIINGRPAVPFGPFLSLGFLLVLFWGTKIISWWLSF